jgi:two-component system nitrate/nitrite sensor histidine kinase NarX
MLPLAGLEIPGALEAESVGHMHIALTNWSQAALLQQDVWNGILWGGVLGFFLSFAIYCSLQYLALRDLSYLTLSLYAISLVIIYSFNAINPLVMGRSGVADPWRVGILSGAVYWISLLLYLDLFLELGKNSPWMHRIVWVCIIVLTIYLPLSLFISERFNLVFTNFVPIPLAIILLVGGLLSWRNNRSALFLVPTLAIPFGVAIMQSGLRLGLANFQLAIDAIPVISNMAMALLLWLAQADRIRHLQTELRTSNQALQESQLRLDKYLETIPLGVAVYDAQLNLVYANRAVNDMLQVYEMPEQRAYERLDAKYQILRYGTEDIYPLEERPMNLAMQGISASADDILLVSGDKRIPLQVWCSPIYDEAGQLIAVINVLADISERRELEQQLAQANTEQQARLQELVDQRTQQEQRQRAIAESLQQSAAVLSSDLNLDTVLAKILDQLHQVISFNSASIFMREEGDLVLAGSTSHSQQPPGSRVSLYDDSHPASWVFHQQRSLVLPGLEEDVQWKQPDGATYQRSWMGTPLLTAGEVIGVLAVESGTVDPVNLQALPILEAFANHAAIAITNARLFGQARNAAILEERNRLARDLHDSVTQMLFSASLIAEAVPTLWKTDPPSVISNLDKLRMLTRGALAEMRTLLLELRPLVLTEVPIERLLINLKDAFTGRTNVPVRLEVCENCEVELPNDVKIAIYRIAQESLNNISKHAEAHRVSIRYQSEGGQVELIIQDDGRGFSGSQPVGGQMGLRTLNERAKSIGAELYITSLPGKGTMVRLTWQPGQNNDGR